MSYELTFLGLLLSLLYVGLTGLYPGGIIVPSYLVLFIDHRVTQCILHLQSGLLEH